MVSLITWAARELRAKTVSLFLEVKAGKLVCPSVRSFIFLFMLPSSPSKVLVAFLLNKTCWSQDQFSIVRNLDNKHPESVHPVVFTLWPKAPKSAAWSARFALVCFQCSFKILPCHLFSFSATWGWPDFHDSSQDSTPGGKEECKWILVPGTFLLSQMIFKRNSLSLSQPLLKIVLPPCLSLSFLLSGPSFFLLHTHVP